MKWIWEPSREWIERTNVWRFMRKLGFKDCDEFLRYSRENTAEFWGRMVEGLASSGSTRMIAWSISRAAWSGPSGFWAGH